MYAGKTFIELTKPQRAFVLAFVQSGFNEDEALKKAGITRRTLNKWKAEDDEFVDYLERLVSNILVETGRAISQTALQYAEEMLGRLLTLARQEENKKVALDAAKAVLQVAANPFFERKLQVKHEPPSIMEFYRRMALQAKKQQALPPGETSGWDEVVDFVHGQLVGDPKVVKPLPDEDVIDAVEVSPDHWEVKKPDNEDD